MIETHMINAAEVDGLVAGALGDSKKVIVWAAGPAVATRTTTTGVAGETEGRHVVAGAAVGEITTVVIIIDLMNNLLTPMKAVAVVLEKICEACHEGVTFSQMKTRRIGDAAMKNTRLTIRAAVVAAMDEVVGPSTNVEVEGDGGAHHISDSVWNRKMKTSIIAGSKVAVNLASMMDKNSKTFTMMTPSINTMVRTRKDTLFRVLMKEWKVNITKDMLAGVIEAEAIVVAGVEAIVVAGEVGLTHTFIKTRNKEENIRRNKHIIITVTFPMWTKTPQKPRPSIHLHSSPQPFAEGFAGVGVDFEVVGVG